LSNSASTPLIPSTMPAEKVHAFGQNVPLGVAVTGAARFCRLVANPKTIALLDAKLMPVRYGGLRREPLP
jgi:hypothetical protein